MIAVHPRLLGRHHFLCTIAVHPRLLGRHRAIFEIAGGPYLTRFAHIATALQGRGYAHCEEM